MEHISVLTVDQRQNYLCKYLKKRGYNATLKTNFVFNDEDIIVCGTPFSKDGKYLNCDFYTSYPVSSFLNLIKSGQTLFGGNIPAEVISYCNNEKIKVFDFSKDEHVVYQNALLTAEGLISKIIAGTPFAINNKNVLIIGFGKCGTIIAQKLKVLGCNIFIYDHTPIHLSQAMAFGYNPVEFSKITSCADSLNIVINTVPQDVLLEEHFATFNNSCVFFEIASKPGGFNNELIEKYKLELNTCPGLPGVTAPKAAGDLLAQNVISSLCT